MHRPPSPPRRLPAALLLLTVLIGTLAGGPAAVAADRGTGFGTWAPLSRTGWHGSMRVGDVHTYCIHPGLPVATDATTDHGTSSDVNGLTPQQLVSINHLVTAYGQTDDPVQAASVGWAVKAIVDRQTTLHSWGYEGDDLAGAIDFIMRRASPENSSAVQERAQRYLAEAEAIPVPRTSGSLTLTTDADDPTKGALTVDIDPAATGSVHLENGVFADTGSAVRENVRAGDTFPIVAPAAASVDGRPYVVRASGSFTVRAAAIRYFSTPGQQESAGPAAPWTFDLSTQDAAPRPVRFSPRIRTTARLVDGAFVDEVTVSPLEGVWPRRSDGSFTTLTATADVYRTNAWPAESDEIPANLAPILQLTLRTDPTVGPGTYTVQAPPLPGPGVYTAVWRIERAEQTPDDAPFLAPGYRWVERFASPSQTEQVAPVAPTASPTPTAPAAPPASPSPPVPVAAAATVASLAATGTPGMAAVSGIGVTVTAAGVGVLAWAVARRRRMPTS